MPSKPTRTSELHGVHHSYFKLYPVCPNLIFLMSLLLTQPLSSVIRGCAHLCNHISIPLLKIYLFFVSRMSVFRICAGPRRRARRLSFRASRQSACVFYLWARVSQPAYTKCGEKKNKKRITSFGLSLNSDRLPLDKVNRGTNGPNEAEITAAFRDGWRPVGIFVQERSTCFFFFWQMRIQSKLIMWPPLYVPEIPQGQVNQEKTEVTRCSLLADSVTVLTFGAVSAAQN